MTINWDDPAERAGLIERVGPEEYGRLQAEHRRESVFETVAGHELRYVQTRFGLLVAVGDTGKAFAELGQAQAFAAANPKGAAQ